METGRIQDEVSMVELGSMVPGWRSRLSSQLRTHTAKWTGAAVGAGIGVGLISRMLMQRTHRRPEVIVIGPVG